jgi:hypothetical protein
MTGADAARHRLEEICEALPEVRTSGDQHVSFEVRGRRFAWLLNDHHGDGRLALVCKAPPGLGGALAVEHPDRFFVPAYVGPRGWLGLRLDTGAVDWDEVERVLVDAYVLTAPKRLARRLA